MLYFFWTWVSYAVCFFFFLNDTATTEIYTLSLHDALPISRGASSPAWRSPSTRSGTSAGRARSEEHTSELQSRVDLVCRLLLEQKKASPGRSNKNSWWLKLVTGAIGSGQYFFFNETPTREFYTLSLHDALPI